MRTRSVLCLAVAAILACDANPPMAPVFGPAFAKGGQSGAGRVPAAFRIDAADIPGLLDDGEPLYVDQQCGVYAWFEDGFAQMNPTAARIAPAEQDTCGDGRAVLGYLDGSYQDLASIKLKVDDWDNPTRATAVVNLRESCVFTRGTKTTGKGLRFNSVDYPGDSDDVFFEKAPDGSSIRFYTYDPATETRRNRAWCEDDHPDSPRSVLFDFDVTVFILP